jgi:dTMP kinase
MPKSTLVKELFISFEGLEGSGKSTQAKRLYEWLISKGYKCVFTQEPGGNEITKKIRAILLDRKNEKLTYMAELLLYLADRAQNVEEIIKPALKSRKIVITDRFSDSTVAYQGGGRELALSVIKDLNRIATSGIKPDLTIFLDIPPKKGLARIKNKDRMESETIKFYERVRERYVEIVKKEPERIKVVNGDSNIKEIEQKIQTIVKAKLKKCLKTL